MIGATFMAGGWRLPSADTARGAPSALTGPLGIRFSCYTHQLSMAFIFDTRKRTGRKRVTRVGGVVLDR